MYKFILFPLLIVILLFANLDVLSNQAAMSYYYKYKYAINRAVHAGALQIDLDALSDGYIRLHEQRAYEATIKVLEQNLVHNPYTIQWFEVVHADSYPYHYTNVNWDIELTLYSPAVILVVKAAYPHVRKHQFNYVWEIYGTSEVVNTL